LGSEPAIYVLDPNILIDYHGVDLSIFTLADRSLLKPRPPPEATFAGY